MTRPRPRFVRERNRKRVTSCGKRRFRDKTEAIRELHRIKTRSHRDTVPARVYHCHLCNGYHLTSQ